MGMYTGLHLTLEFNHDTPKEVLDVLDFMSGNTEIRPAELPNHPLFMTERWSSMLLCRSYYHFNDLGTTQFTFDPNSRTYTLLVLSSFKNYGDEIRKFLSWTGPYVYGNGDGVFGYHWYEESAEPTFIRRNDLGLPD